MPATSTAVVPTGGHGPFFAVCGPAFEALDDCDYAGVVAEHDRHVPWLRELGDLDTVRYLQYVAAMALSETGATERATELVLELLGGLGRGGDPLWRAKALALSAELSLVSGHHARAVEHLADAQDLLEDNPSRQHNHLSATMAGGLALQAAGVFEDADAAFRQVLLDSVDQRRVASLDVLPELAMLHAAWAARADLADDPEAPGRWVRVVSLTLRWHRAAVAIGDAGHASRALACQAFAWQRLGEHDAAAAAVGGVDLLTQVPGGRLEGLLARLHRAGVDVAAGRYGRAREHLDVALEREALGAPGVWTATVLAAHADVDIAEHGPHPAVQRWRRLAQGLLGTLATQSRSFASEVAARRRLGRMTSHADRVSQDAMTDALTGLANRRGLDDALERAAVAGTSLGACFVDVDRFKGVNDEFSHAVGDEVLAAVAGVLTEACREGDLVARYGGDEFVVLAAADAAALEPMAQRVRSAIAEHPWAQLAEGLEVTVSVGVAPWLPAAAVLASADAALLAAKRGGRDRVALAS